MDYVLYYIIALLLFIILWMGVSRTRWENRLRRLANDAIAESILERMEWQSKYAALETGADEQQENYEQTYLDLWDTIRGLRNEGAENNELILELEQMRLDHGSYCLPTLYGDFYPMAEEDDTPIHDSVVFDHIG